MNSTIFIAPSLWNNQLNDYFAIGFFIALIVLQIRLLQRRRGHDPKVYSPALAWLRASSYFCLAYLIGWGSGVIDSVLAKPLFSDEQLHNPLWLALTAACFVVILFGYLRIWKVGTFNDGRIYRWWLTPWYGIAWGFAQASIFMSIWAGIELFGWPLWISGLVAYFAIGGYNGCWQQFYWDIYVSPPHNEKAFNTRKVLLAHTPNLIITMIYIALFGNLGIYFILQGIALGISASILRFPAWWDNYSAEAGATR
jgi:hypothetical protein